MSTLILILSFPFWFIGLFILAAALFGTVYIGEAKNTIDVRLTFIFISCVFLVIAWLMTF